MGGLDAELTYDIDIAKAAGSRIIEPVATTGAPSPRMPLRHRDQQLPQSGGGNFPHVKTAPVLYNRTVEIRQLLIDWVTTNKVIDPPSFATVDWRLTSGGTPITITG